MYRRESRKLSLLSDLSQPGLGAEVSDPALRRFPILQPSDRVVDGSNAAVDEHLEHMGTVSLTEQRSVETGTETREQPTEHER